MVAHFMTGHIHMGFCRLPKDDESEACPLCAADNGREHSCKRVLPSLFHVGIGLGWAMIVKERNAGFNSISLLPCG